VHPCRRYSAWDENRVKQVGQRYASA
jgi:hypothetical protein